MSKQENCTESYTKSDPILSSPPLRCIALACLALHSSRERDEARAARALQILRSLVEVLTLDLQVVLQLAGLLQLGVLPVVQRALPQVVVAGTTVRGVGEEQDEAEAEDERDLIEPEQESNSVSADPRHEAEDPISRDEREGCGRRVYHRARQLGSSPPRDNSEKSHHLSFSQSVDVVVFVVGFLGVAVVTQRRVHLCSTVASCVKEKGR
eukprot:CAMPEP_0194748842 /NCGR_PEP_ID=MMETSP0323_2-20130528/3020_1 /TAXON_ID=2866 ORGANISM="Crypthecodinium cohnii, Strain Seligo" /NCGR_SAMPLE_ID=MMETSP0323_2 /ASSEMBLY_ACC=CAM_ASM_000346 /LENGTH=209 /DNA_ID=CAMNT_0039663461 /DNA_START=32 /DNA_END=658 /DNA_ORIENTATION=-